MLPNPQSYIRAKGYSAEAGLLIFYFAKTIGSAPQPVLIRHRPCSCAIGRSTKFSQLSSRHNCIEIVGYGANDIFHHIIHSRVDDAMISNGLPTAKHHDTVRDRKNILQAMADDDYRDPVHAQMFDQVKNFADLLDRKACGRLVHDHHTSLKRY